MGKRRWDEASALAFITGADADKKRKRILLNGKSTLTESGAIDYLRDNCGYRVN